MEVLHQKETVPVHQRKVLLQLNVQEAATVNLRGNDLSQLRGDIHPG